jgi:hypothetical protein
LGQPCPVAPGSVLLGSRAGNPVPLGFFSYHIDVAHDLLLSVSGGVIACPMNSVYTSFRIKQYLFQNIFRQLRITRRSKRDRRKPPRRRPYLSVDDFGELLTGDIEQRA